MTHKLELDAGEDDTYWGFCSCERWSAGPDTDSEEIVAGFMFHLACARGDRLPPPDGFPEWDDPEDLTPDQAMTIEEVAAWR